MVGPPGRSLKYLAPPSALPPSASISGELKFCFTDAIHGGHCSLITALRVLPGTDCKASHPATQHHLGPMWRCQGCSFVETSRQMQISYSAGTIAQSYKCCCHLFLFFYLSILSSRCLQQVKRERSPFFVQLQNTRQHSCEGRFVWRLRFCYSLSKAGGKTDNRLLGL